jgi:hypothetical protein
MRALLLLLPLMALASCERGPGAPAAGQSGAPETVAASATTSTAATLMPSVAASVPAAGPGGARTVSEENALYSFDYAYPAAAGAIPGLKAWLDGEIDKQRTELVAQARTGRAEAKQGGFPYSAYYQATGWQVVTDIPAWLSLSAGVESYAGGAHPNHWFAAMLWDKRAGQRRAASDLFVSKQALSQAIRAPFCAEIDRQRAEKRGEKVNRTSGDMFDECIDPAAQHGLFGRNGLVLVHRRPI